MEAKEIPSILCNRYYIHVTGDNVRISFGEDFGEFETFWRNSIVLNIFDAKEFLEHLKSMIEPVKNEFICSSDDDILF